MDAIFYDVSDSLVLFPHFSFDFKQLILVVLLPLLQLKYLIPAHAICIDQFFLERWNLLQLSIYLIIYIPNI
jgi:hypothetical protein